MTFEIRPIRAGEHEAARRLLLDNGWAGRHFEADVFPVLIERAVESLVAVEGDRVVGFCRVLGDGMHNGYISMVVVDAGWRKRGVGRAMVQRAMGDDPDMTWVLRAARPNVQAFYEKLGFRRSDVAMERPRA